MKKTELDLLQGTLDMLILKTLSLGRMHGYAVARHIQQTTDGVLSVEEGSLYPALHRMAQRGWIESEWGRSENNRRAKFYQLTRKGARQLETELAAWRQFTDATFKVLSPEPSGA
ncbi:MAG: PadR family transcriptional regulator [Gemmatimonadota bacterium]